MFVVEIISILLALAVLIAVMARLLAAYRMKKIKNIETYPVEFQKKYTVFKTRTNEKHVFALLVVSGLLSLGLLLATGMTLYQQGQLNHLSKTTKQLTNQIDQLRSQQNQLITKMPVRAYPESGLDLKDYDWEQVFKAESGSPEQAKLETELAQKMAPYFGLSQVVISIDVPTQSLAVSLTGNSENITSKDVITQNVKAFVTEANQITKLTNLQIKMTATNEKKNETLFKAAYQRKDDKAQFQEINSSEGDDSDDK